jgi:hypothetical protein
MRNNLVPQRRIQVRYVTVTQMRGYSCTVEVPVVSVSAVVDDYPHGSICHTATTRRNRARSRLESEPHDLDELPLSRLRGISPGSDKLSCSPGLLSTFRGSDTAGRTVEHGHIGTHWATTNTGNGACSRGASSVWAAVGRRRSDALGQVPASSQFDLNVVRVAQHDERTAPRFP